LSGGICVAHIDLSALQHNLQRVRSLAGSRSILAMVKADGYGHGLLRVAQALEKADAFGVAGFEEAVALREGGITQPIIIMSRFNSADQISLCLQYQLGVVVNRPYQIEILEKTPVLSSSPLTVWLKIETGMHRLGLLREEFIDAHRRLRQLPWIHQPVGMMMHFACADTPDHPLNATQMEVFQNFTRDFSGPKSMANSAAILSNPKALCDWVRPGIMLYGASPFKNQTGEQCGLRPVMTLTSRLIAVRKLQPGDFVGYSATWQCPVEMPAGVVAIGYGDGYPRHARNGTPVLVNGVICPLIGRVSMDMIVVDLRPVPDAKVNDPVVLWGNGLPVEWVADCAETISYELFCQVTRRVEFIAHE
jgi:alanine racemase